MNKSFTIFLRSDPGLDDIRDWFVVTVPDMAAVYGAIAASRAAEWFMKARFLDGVQTVYQATPAQIVAAASIVDRIKYGAGSLYSNGVPAGASFMSELLGGIVGQSAYETVWHNADNDPESPVKVLVAHPMACAWCRALAADGWATKRDTPPHSNGCRCSLVPTWSGEIDGYSTRQFQKQKARAENKLPDTAGFQAVLAEMRRLDGTH